MNLEKAIEISQTYHDCYSKYMDSKEGAALKVLIQAGERLKYARNHPSGWELEPLLGETEE